MPLEEKEDSSQKRLVDIHHLFAAAPLASALPILSRAPFAPVTALQLLLTDP